MDTDLLPLPKEIVTFYILSQIASSPCAVNNGGCSHFCVARTVGFECVCPTGLTVKEDGKTCEDSKGIFVKTVTITQLTIKLVYAIFLATSLSWDKTTNFNKLIKFNLFVCLFVCLFARQETFLKTKETNLYIMKISNSYQTLFKNIMANQSPLFWLRELYWAHTCKYHTFSNVNILCKYFRFHAIF